MTNECNCEQTTSNFLWFQWENKNFVSSVLRYIFFIKPSLDPDSIRVFLFPSLHIPSVKLVSSPLACTMQFSAHAHTTHWHNHVFVELRAVTSYPAHRFERSASELIVSRGVTLVIAVVTARCYLATGPQSIVFIINKINRQSPVNRCN